MKETKLSKSQQRVMSVFCDISDREQIVLRLRFCNNKKQTDVAEILKVTPERVRQIEEYALLKIAEIMAN